MTDSKGLHAFISFKLLVSRKIQGAMQGGRGGRCLWSQLHRRQRYEDFFCGSRTGRGKSEILSEEETKAKGAGYADKVLEYL
jgi:hypothetical protein